MFVAVRIQPLKAGLPDGDPLTATGSLTDGTFTVAAETAPGQEADVFAVELHLEGEEEAVLALGLELGLETRGIPDSRIDQIAPLLSAPTDAADGRFASTGSVSTNEGNGTLHWVVTTSSRPPTAQQVRGGQDHTGAPVPTGRKGSQAVSATGVQNIAPSSLTDATAYYTHFMHEDAAGNRSTVASADGFTTEATFDPATFLPDAIRAWILPGTAHNELYAEITGSPPATPVGTASTAVGTVRDLIASRYYRAYSVGGVPQFHSELGRHWLTFEAVDGIQSDDLFTLETGWHLFGAVRGVETAGATPQVLLRMRAGSTSYFQISYRPDVARLMVQTRGAAATPSAVAAVNSDANGALAGATDLVVGAYLGVGANKAWVNGSAVTLTNAANGWSPDHAVPNARLWSNAATMGAHRLYRALMVRKADRSEMTAQEVSDLTTYLAEGMPA